jgi:hypothetical protein
MGTGRRYAQIGRCASVDRGLWTAPGPVDKSSAAVRGQLDAAGALVFPDELSPDEPEEDDCDGDDGFDDGFDDGSPEEPELDEPDPSPEVGVDEESSEPVDEPLELGSLEALAARLSLR